MNDDKHMQAPRTAPRPVPRPPGRKPDTVGTRYLRRLLAGLGEPSPRVLADRTDPDREAGA